MSWTATASLLVLAAPARAQFALVVLAFVCLAISFATSDFSVELVALYETHAEPIAADVLPARALFDTPADEITDTVLADPEEWTRDPWSGDLVDGEVWGRGALDMKGQVAASAVAFASRPC